MTRRTRGDGTLFKRGDGYWCAGVELPPGPDGKRRTKRIVRKQRNAVIEELRKIRGQVAAGRIPDTNTTTVAKWLDYWHEAILPMRKVSPDTIDSYESVIRLHIKPALGALRLDKVTPAAVRDLYKAMHDKGITRTAQKADQVLRLAFKAAVREGLIYGNVMDRVDKPLHSKKEGQSFAPAVAMHLITTAEKTQGVMWAARWALGFVTGARESEVLGLERDRVDLDRGFIDISWQLKRMKKTHGCGVKKDGNFPCGMKRPSFCPQAQWKFPAGMQWRECVDSFVWTRPKSRAGMRLIPLVPQMVDILSSLPEGPNPHNLVFHHPDGRPFSNDQDQKMWKQLLIAAKVPHAPQHSIRHSTATRLMEARVDQHIVTSTIGHSDIAVTRGYQHVSMELAATAWSNLGVMLPVSDLTD